MNQFLQSTFKSFSMKKKSIFLMLMFALMAFLAPTSAEASHFRYGSISWTRPNDASRVVTFKITTGWRISYFGGVSIGATVNPSSGNLNFGDATSSATLTYVVTSINAAEDWFVAERVITHTYAVSGTSFNAFFTNCCRLSTLQNNADGTFRCETVVQLVSGNTGSPVSTVPAIINLAAGQSAAPFNVPANDPDNQSLTFSLATAAQTGVTNLTGLNVNSTTGAATFNTIGKTPTQLFTGAISITDASGSITVVDFIIRIVAANTPPIFDYSVTPANNYVFSINPGQTLAFNIKALDVDNGSTVFLNVSGAPSGSSFSPSLPNSPSNPTNTSFSYTPTNSQLGVYVMTFIAERNGGVQTFTSVTINVNTNPIFISPTRAEATDFYIPTGVQTDDIAKATNPDPSVTTRILSASIPAGATLSSSLPTSLSSTPQVTMSWTPWAADFGTHTIVFTAEDANNKTATRTYTLNPNSLPSFTSTANETAYENQLYTYDIVVSDSDVAYGDELEIISSSLPSWLTLTDNGDGTATLTGTPSASDIGNVTITLTGEDLWHMAHTPVEQSFTISVNPCQFSYSIDAIPTSCPNGNDGSIEFNNLNNGVEYSLLWSNSSTDGAIFDLTPGWYYVTITSEFGCSTYDSVEVLGTPDETAPSITCPSDITVSTDAGVCKANVTVTGPEISESCGSVCNTDGLEEYTTTAVSGQSPQWKPWSNTAASSVVSTDQAFNGTKSLKVSGNANGGPQDQLFLLGNQTAGNWELSFMVYIPAGHTGYYNLQHFETAGVQWAHQLQFNSNGSGRLNRPGGNVAFSYPQGNWFEVKQLIDQTANQTVLIINGVTVSSWQFSKQFNNAAGANQIGALDFFPVSNFLNSDPNPSATPLFYIDDVKLCGSTTDISTYIARRYSKAYPTGTNTVNYEVTDMAGNASSCSFDVTVNDNEAPVVNTQNVTVTLVNGSATVNASQINNASTDNCGIASYSLSKTNFSCSDIGVNNVTLTVTDIHNNTSTGTATVTVVGSIPSVSISQGVLPGFCQGGSIVLTASGSSGSTYSWNTGATTAVINVNATGTYTVTATNSFGCTSTASTYVAYNATSLLSSYTILATHEAELEGYSYVQTGGVGVTSSCGGELEVENHSTITGSTTFGKAKDIDVSSNSTVTTKYYSAATVSLPSFKHNPYYNSGSNVNVASNATVTLNDSIYKNITIGTNATVTFTKPVVYIRSLTSCSNAKIKFSNCTVLRIYDEVELGPYNQFNIDEKSVVVYARDEFEVERGSTVFGAIYSLEEIETEGTNSARVTMKGLFIGEEVEGEYTTWNWNNVCTGCSLNKTQPTAQADNNRTYAKDEININVFPNPTEGPFNVEINSAITGPLTITVLNYLGQEVQTISKPNFNGTASVRIDLQDAASTYYMVRIEMGGQTLYRKVILTKF